MMKIKTVGFDQLFVSCDVLALRSKTTHILEAIEQVAWADAVYPFGEYITRQTNEHDCGHRCLEKLGALVLGRADWYLATISPFVLGMPFWVTDPLVRGSAKEDWLARSIRFVLSNRLCHVQTRTVVNWQGLDIETDVTLGQMPVATRAWRLRKYG